MKIEKDYLDQYLNEWKESVYDIFTTDELMDGFLRVKTKQFDLKSYKKSLKKQLEEQINN
jgi:hypothetical protein